MIDRDRVGELRPSQLLHTYGVGATVELPQLTTIVLGIDDWPRDSGVLVSEPRLLAAVRKRLGAQLAELRTPPRDEESQAGVGVPVAPFPRWLVCPVCRLLAPIESGLFALRRDPWRPDRTRYVHECTTRGLPPTAFPARFLLACRKGHIDDFPWDEFVHRGKGHGDTLRLREFGSGGGPVDVQVECDGCDAMRRLGDAFGDKAKDNLPTSCRGRHPHLGTNDDCGERVRTILLGASNAWFPVVLSALSIPSDGGRVDQAVAERWAVLERVTSREILQFALDTNEQLASLRELGAEEVMAAIERRRSGGDGAEEVADLRLPEWELLSVPSEAPGSDDFRLRPVAAPPGFEREIAEVVLVERLREVVSLTGFTRVESPDDVDDAGQQVPAARLSREPPSWVPCTEVRGEGVFLRLDDEPLADWEERYRSSGRAQRLWEAHQAWRARRRLEPEGGWPGARYVLLHSLAHALIRELALECGYGASSIRERIYSARPDAPEMAGVLLYTAAADSEGTLGGLVSLGEPEQLTRLLGQALDRARLCSADPLCSEHDPLADGSVHHAACHACQFASETSCERGNRFLDRAALVDTFASAATAYFRGR